MPGFVLTRPKTQHLRKIPNFFFVLLRAWLWGLWAPPPALPWFPWARQGMGFPEVFELVLQPGVVLPCEDAGDVPNFPLCLRLVYLLQGLYLFFLRLLHPDHADPPLLVLV